MEKVTISFELDESEADALAEFVKRVGWTEWRQNAIDDEEAYRIKYAFGVLQKALSTAGFSPR